MYVESMEAIRILNHDDMICFEYDNKIEKVEVRMATSLISKEQAKVIRYIHQYLAIQIMEL